MLGILPWLFYEGEPAAKARHDYWYTVNQRYVESFTAQIGNWCQAHNLAFTGHLIAEQDLAEGIRRNGAVMPHYSHFHVPGVDMLTEQNHEIVTVKQCTSVAHQFGRRRVLSEMYGCAGWEFTFEGQKWVADWQYALGVNLRCQHIGLYSLRGCRKRDYPPVFGYNTTWWKYNGVVEDYFARVGRVLTEGTPVRDVLLLHPVTTGWSMLGEHRDSARRVSALGQRFRRSLQAILAAHYDLDLGDEQIMAALGSVSGQSLRVGEAAYRLVVLPPGVRTLLGSTVDLLERFVDAGGRIIAFDPVPTMIEAEPSSRLAQLLGRPGVLVLPEAARIETILEEALPRRVSLRSVQGQEAGSFLYMQRRLDSGSAYFLVNTDRNNCYDLDVTLEGSGRIEEWDPLTGRTEGIPAEQLGDRLRFRACFGPAGSRLYVVDPRGSPLLPHPELLDADPRITHLLRGKATFIGPSCSFTRTDPNVLTLDSCRYRLGGGEWSDEMEVWRAQKQVREALGMRPNHANGITQRYRWAMEPHPRDGAPLELRFDFLVRQAPSAPAFLLVEGAERFGIVLNDAPVANEPAGWYLDRAFHKVPLPALRPGENVLTLRCAYTQYVELEDCYLLGDFAASTDRAIMAEPSVLHFGDWTLQGYPHYAGSMIYHSQVRYEPGEKVALYLDEYRAVDVAVHVNGRLAGHIPWRAANGLDITGGLVPGANALDIEVVASPRNMLGPLHQASGHDPITDWQSFRRSSEPDHHRPGQGDPAITDWQSFRRSSELYTPGYVLQPWGLMGQVMLRRQPE